jgi:hypothetical protein
VHFEVVRARVGDSCEFELAGLEPGLAYEVVFVPSQVEGAAAVLPSGTPRGFEVTAPASGIVLEPSLVAVHLVVQHEGAAVAGTQLQEVVPVDAPRASVPEPLRRGFAQVGRRGDAIVLLAPDQSTTLRVTAPSFEPVELSVDPRELPVERGELLGPVAVELRSKIAPAVIEWHFDYSGPGTLDGAHVTLQLRETSGGMPTLGPSPLIAGAARFEPAPVGSFIARPVIHFSQETALADLPMALDMFLMQQLTTRSGEVTVVDASVARGGRIELSLIGRDPALPAPRVMLIERTGNEVLPVLFTSDGDGAGHRTAHALDSDGPFFLDRVLPPGEYTVRVEGEGYARVEQTATVRVGETTRVVAVLE